MPVGIVETALVIAAAKGAKSKLKKRRRRGRRRQFFAAQRTAIAAEVTEYPVTNGTVQPIETEAIEETVASPPEMLLEETEAETATLDENPVDLIEKETETAIEAANFTEENGS